MIISFQIIHDCSFLSWFGIDIEIGSIEVSSRGLEIPIEKDAFEETAGLFDKKQFDSRLRRSGWSLHRGCKHIEEPSDSGSPFFKFFVAKS